MICQEVGLKVIKALCLLTGISYLALFSFNETQMLSQMSLIFNEFQLLTFTISYAFWSLFLSDRYIVTNLICFKSFFSKIKKQ